MNWELNWNCNYDLARELELKPPELELELNWNLGIDHKTGRRVTDYGREWEWEWELKVREWEWELKL